MFRIFYTTADFEAPILIPSSSRSINIDTEQEANEVFDELLYGEEDLFSLSMRNTDWHRDVQSNELDYMQISILRIQMFQFKESLIDLERI